MGDQVDRLHFLGGHCGKEPAPFVGLQQHLVGYDVKFFLDFTLHVFTSQTAQHAPKRAFADGMTDGFAGTRDDLNQEPDFWLKRMLRALLFNQVLRKRFTFHVGETRKMKRRESE